MKSNLLTSSVASILMTAVFLLATASAFAQESAADPSKTVATEKVAEKTAPLAVDQKTKGSPTVAETEQQKTETSASTPVVPAIDRHSSGAIPTRPNPFDSRMGASAVKPKQPDPGSEWQFAFAPYLFMPSLTGTIGARGRTSDIDLSFSKIFDHLDFGLMGAFEAKKGKLIITNDLVWTKLEEERNTPGGLYSTAKLGVNMFIFDPEVGYRVYEGDGGSFDVLGGVRIMSVETNLDFRAGILPAFDVSQRKTWATPVIGAHGVANLSPKFFLATKFDIGGLVGADFTGQFYGGGGYRLTPKIALIGGYRYMKTDYDDNSGFLFNTSMSGLLFGAKFAF